VVLLIKLLLSSYVARLRHSFYTKHDQIKLSAQESIVYSFFSLGIFASDECLLKVQSYVFKLKNSCEEFLIKAFVPVYIFCFIVKYLIEACHR
jgi:hypothetical protein